jgi:hypothetical protein
MFEAEGTALYFFYVPATTIIDTVVHTNFIIQVNDFTALLFNSNELLFKQWYLN